MIRVKKWSMLVEWEDDTYDILDKSNIKNEIKCFYIARIKSK